MRAKSFSTAIASLCFGLAAWPYCWAQAQTAAEVEDQANKAKDPVQMLNAAGLYIAAGDAINARRAYRGAWDYARYWAVYDPAKSSTVTGVGGSGTRRAFGLAQLAAMRNAPLPGYVTSEVREAAQIGELMEESQKLERQNTADNPPRVLSEDNKEGLWVQGPATIKITQLGTQVSIHFGDLLECCPLRPKACSTARGSDT